MKKFYLENNITAKSLKGNNTPDDSEGEAPKFFDIENELKKIKSEYHGQEGLDKIKELKDAWRFQKMGLVEIQNKVIDEIYSNSENFTAEKFFNDNQEVFDKYLLSPEVLAKIKRALAICENRIYRINYFKNKCLLENGEIDDKKMFGLVFGFEPNSDIKCIVEPLCLYFKIRDEKDFALVFTGAFLKKRKIGKKDIENSKCFAGAKIDKTEHRDLNGGVAIENPRSFDNIDFSKEILGHERKHVFNDILFRVHLSDSQMGLKIIKKLGLEEDEERIVDIANNAVIEKFIKDEILAYFSEEKLNTKKISEALLGDSTIYSYGFDYNFLETDGEYMHLDYLKIVQNGIVALVNLMEAGYSKKEIQGLLVTEPLLSWPKVSQRIIGKIKSKEKNQVDIIKNISPKIIKKTKETMEDMMV
jgi:hypothetical protein